MNCLLLRVFDIRAPSTTKSAYIFGSWDDYAGSTLTASKLETGLWTITVNIPITIPSQPNPDFVQKYWYYYLVDDIRHYDKNHDWEVESTGQVSNHFLVSISIKSCEGSSPGASHILNGNPLPLSRLKMPTPITLNSNNLILTFEHENRMVSNQQSHFSEPSSGEESCSDEESCSECGEDEALI